MDEPDECKGRRSGEDGASGADGGDFELRTWTAGVCVVGEGGCPYAGLLAKQLGGDDEVAEVLEEALVVGAAKTGVDGLLCSC